MNDVQHIYPTYMLLFPNTYTAIYMLDIYIGGMCWATFSRPLYMLGNIYICWSTCTPTYMKCYPTYIGSQKCYPTYMTSYMLDNNVGFWPDIYVGQHHDICWVTVCILGINYDICWIYMLGYICWTHRLYMLDIIEYMLDNISGKWVPNIYVMLPNIYVGIYMLGKNCRYMLDIYVGHIGHICWVLSSTCWVTTSYICWVCMLDT